MNHVKGQVFFTLDGEVVKSEEILSGAFFPCVGLHSTGQRVRINFGRFPFRFNIEAMREQSRAEQLAQIDSLPTPSFSRIVYNYLLFHGYKRTAEAYLQSHPPDLLPLAERDEKMADSLPLRAEAMKLLKARQIEQLKTLLATHFPSDADLPWIAELLFALDCQTFLDHIREKRLSNALEMVQKEFYEWWDDWTQERIEECCSLLAYAKPETSPAYYLLSDRHMKQLAELLNRCLLLWTGGLNNAPTYPPSSIPSTASSSSSSLPKTHPIVSATISSSQKANGKMHEQDLLLEAVPDLHILLTHLSQTQHDIRVHRSAGEIFDLGRLTENAKPTQEKDKLKSSRSSPVK